MSENGRESLIRLEGVTKVFVTDEVETHALSGIQLDLKKGEYLSIAGPSGCGKSTLLAILGLLDTPSDGTYTLNSRPVSGLKLSERARIRNREIGFIFQAFNLIGDLTVYENVELPLTYRGMGSAERKKRVQEALERVGMSHRMKHYPSQLSGGQQQRVAVARALGRRSGHPAGGRADRQPGFGQRRSRHESAEGSASQWRHHLYGDSRSALCAIRGPHHPHVRRADRRGKLRGLAELAGTGRGPKAREGRRMLLASALLALAGAVQPARNLNHPSGVQPGLSPLGARTSDAPERQWRRPHPRLGS